jgi:hypothetical protein
MFVIISDYINKNHNNIGPRNRLYDFKNIFAKKIGVWTHFFDEIRQKSQKFVIITLVQDFVGAEDVDRRHDRHAGEAGPQHHHRREVLQRPVFKVLQNAMV